jgi:hypothetical protein
MTGVLIFAAACLVLLVHCGGDGVQSAHRDPGYLERGLPCLLGCSCDGFALIAVPPAFVRYRSNSGQVRVTG